MLDGREGLVQGFEHVDAGLQKPAIVVLRSSKVLDATSDGRRFGLVAGNTKHGSTFRIVLPRAQ